MNKYVLSRRLKQSVLLVGSRIKSGREFQAIGPATGNARRPQVLTVCLCARICGTARPEFTSFLRMLSMTVTRFSSGGVAVCYVLPVLWMTSCLHIMARNRRREKAYRPISSDSPGVSSQHRAGTESDVYGYVVQFVHCFTSTAQYRSRMQHGV